MFTGHSAGGAVASLLFQRLVHLREYGMFFSTKYFFELD